MILKILKVVCQIAVAAGLLVFFYGLWLAWKPLGFIVGGLVLAIVTFLLSYPDGLAELKRRGH